MASGGERGASVSGDGNHSGRASGGGSSAPACFESAARATGSAHPGLCRSHGDGAGPTASMLRGGLWVAPDSGEPRPGSSQARHGGRSEGADLWCVLRGAISASRVELFAGGAMKVDQGGRLWVDRVTDRCSWVMLERDF